MNLVQALELVNDCARVKKLMGMNATYPYTQDQFVSALIALQMELRRVYPPKVAPKVPRA